MYERFAKLMNKRGLTHYKVAKESGVDQATLSRWKNGKGTPSLETLQILADYFDVRLDYLRGRSDLARLEIISADPADAMAQQKSPQLEAEGGLRDSSLDSIEAAREKYRNHPTQKAFFSLTDKATPEDIDAAYNIAIAYLKGKGYIPDE